MHNNSATVMQKCISALMQAYHSILLLPTILQKRFVLLLMGNNAEVDHTHWWPTKRAAVLIQCNPTTIRRWSKNERSFSIMRCGLKDILIYMPELVAYANTRRAKLGLPPVEFPPVDHE